MSSWLVNLLNDYFILFKLRGSSRLTFNVTGSFFNSSTGSPDGSVINGLDDLLVCSIQ